MYLILKKLLATVSGVGTSGLAAFETCRKRALLPILESGTRTRLNGASVCPSKESSCARRIISASITLSIPGWKVIAARPIMLWP